MAIPPMPALDSSIIAIAVILASGVYGVVAGKQRLRIFILSIYVGIVMAGAFDATAAPYLKMLGPDQISLVLLSVPILIFGFFGVMHAKHHAKGAVIANVIVGLLAGCLIASAALHLFPTSEMTAVDNGSFIAMMLQQYYLFFLGGLPVIALALGFMKSEKGR